MKKGTRKFRFSFEETHLTHYGGMCLIQSFCNKLDLRRLLQRHIVVPYRSGEYQPADMILALMFAIIAGMRRINKTETLQYNGTFLNLLGLDRFPDQSTLRRFLHRLPPTAIRQLARLHDRLRARLFSYPHGRTTLIFDLDSVVIVIHGKAQYARIGYNPKKPGRRSYHPLFCFESHRQEFWHGRLRPGDAGSSTGVIPFLRDCLCKVPSTIARSRIRFRMDSGFFGKRVVEFLDREKCGYVIVAKKHKHIKNLAHTCRFRPMGFGWEVGQFRYTPYGWKKAHRFVVVRHPIPEDPAEKDQPPLFTDKKYVYHVFVTSLRMKSWRVYLFYRPRANIEKNVRQLLYDYPLGKIPTQRWVANVAFFHILLFAFDLVHWFKRLALPVDYLVKDLETIRTELLVIPARATQSGSVHILKLPKDYHHHRVFLEAYRKIQKFRLPR